MQNIGFLAVQRPVMEANDCAVRALANATDMPYSEAHELFFEQGRRPNKSTGWSVLLRVYNEFGTLRTTRVTIAAFLLQHPAGTFICQIPGHVFAVRDGVVMDTGISGMTKVVRHFWEFDEYKPISEFVPEAPQVVPNRYRPRAFSVTDLLNKVNSVRVAETQR